MCEYACSLQEHWATALKTLTLSLDEVVHIRSVLTKAELEGLPLDGDLKDDVAKGKICFLCMKTRFGFFSWGVRCQLCKQQVCSKCSTKLNSAEIDAEYDNAPAASNGLEQERPPNSLDVTSCYDHASPHTSRPPRRGRALPAQ